ncbi:MAG: tetratricopeptide repeat protein [Flavobacteriales bacterium]
MEFSHCRFIYRILFLLLFSSPFLGFSQEGGARSDSSIFYARDDSVWNYFRKNTDSALMLARRNLSFAEKLDQGRLKNIAYSTLGTALMKTGDLKSGIRHFKKSLRYDKKLRDSSGLSNSHSNLGLAYAQNGQYDSALFHYKKALRIGKAIGATHELAGIYSNMGNIYRIRSNLIKGLEYYQKGLKLADSTGEGDKATLLGNLGVVHKKRGALDKALKNYREARKLFKEKGKDRKVAVTDLSIGGIYMNKEEYERALRYYRRAHRFFRKIGAPRRKAQSQLKLAGLFITRGDRDSGLYYARKALRSSKKNGFVQTGLGAKEKIAQLLAKKGQHQRSLEMALEGYEKAQKLQVLKWKKGFAAIIYRDYKELGHYEKALSFHEVMAQLRDSLKNEKRAEKLTRMEMRYKFEKQQMKDSLQHAKEMKVKNMKVKKKEAEIARQKTVRNFLLGGGLVLILFLALLFERFRVARKRKEEIEKKKTEVDRAYAQLHEKNSELEDSIHYASRIQSAILTSNDYLEETLGEHFVFFKPKELVSGDFYWAYRDERYSLWLTADCTGHGVPGAFMSMIGNRLFNEIVVEEGERDPGKVLEEVRKRIIQALDQGNEEETNDGMDAALCVLDRKKRKLHFAGAQNPLYIVQKVEEKPLYDGVTLEEGAYRLTEVKGTRSPIGRDPYRTEAFQTVTLKFEGGERFYTFSDGFPDQFGGPNGKKYRYKPFKRLLLSLQEKDMSQQKEALEQEFREWKGEQEQVDDVLVIGAKVPER